MTKFPFFHKIEFLEENTGATTSTDNHSDGKILLFVVLTPRASLRGQFRTYLVTYALEKEK